MGSSFLKYWTRSFRTHCWMAHAFWYLCRRLFICQKL